MELYVPYLAPVKRNAPEVKGGGKKYEKQANTCG